jgi:hypothetical protein
LPLSALWTMATTSFMLGALLVLVCLYYTISFLTPPLISLRH